MSIDWDGLVLGPAMSIFGDGSTNDPSSWPTYRVSAKSPAVPLPGAVFDAQYQRVVDLATGSTESSTHPVLGVRDAVFAAAGIAAAQGGIVYVPSIDQVFVVMNPEPDGHGHTLLILMEAA